MKHFFTLFLGLLASLTPLSTHAITVNDLCPFTDASTGLKWGYGFQVSYGNDILVDGGPVHSTGLGKWRTNGTILQFEDFCPENDNTRYVIVGELVSDKFKVTGFHRSSGDDTGLVMTYYTEGGPYSGKGYLVDPDTYETDGVYYMNYYKQELNSNLDLPTSETVQDKGALIKRFDIEDVAITTDGSYAGLEYYDKISLYSYHPDCVQTYTIDGTTKTDIPVNFNYDTTTGTIEVENFVNFGVPAWLEFDSNGNFTVEQSPLMGNFTRSTADGSLNLSFPNQIIYQTNTPGIYYLWSTTATPNIDWGVFLRFSEDPFTTTDYKTTVSGTIKPIGTPSHYAVATNDFWVSNGGKCYTLSQAQMKLNDFTIKKSNGTTDHTIKNYVAHSNADPVDWWDWTLELTLSNVSIQLLNLPGESGKIHITADYQLGGYFGWFDSLELFAYPARVTSVAGRADLNATTGITGAINLSAAASGSSTSSGSSAGGTIHRAMPSIRANSPSSGTITLDVPEDAFPNGANFDAPVTLFAKVNYSIPNDLEPTFHALSVVTPRVPSGIDTTEFDLAQPAQYFDLQGRPVAAPAPGQLLLKHQGTSVSKVRF